MKQKLIDKMISANHKKYIQCPWEFKFDMKEMQYLARIIEDEDEAVLMSKQFYLSGSPYYQKLVTEFMNRTRMT